MEYIFPYMETFNALFSYLPQLCCYCFKNYFSFSCISGEGAHECRIQERPEKGAGSFGTVVTSGCELPVWKLEIKFSQVFSKDSKSC